jgi:hypothetical protein
MVNRFQFSNVGAVGVTCNLHCQKTDMCVKVSSHMQYIWYLTSAATCGYSPSSSIIFLIEIYF